MFVQSYYIRIVKLYASAFERRKSNNTRDKSKARKFFLSLEIFLQAETVNNNESSPVTFSSVYFSYFLFPLALLLCLKLGFLFFVRFNI